MMASRRMGALIEEISTRYPDRIVIVDTPPALAISDPSVISSHAGQVLMVVEAGATSMKAVEQSLGLITGCEHVSFVLNKTSFTAGSNRFGSYSYYKAEHP
jgi:receptor protein-tyrosine kinase